MSSPLCIPFTLQQHLQECHYATVDYSCGRQVLLGNKGCSQRQVNCSDCGEAMSYKELQVK